MPDIEESVPEYGTMGMPISQGNPHGIMITLRTNDNIVVDGKHEKQQYVFFIDMGWPTAIERDAEVAKLQTKYQPARGFLVEPCWV